MDAVKMVRSFWFLNAYAVLMIVAPAINWLVSMEGTETEYGNETERYSVLWGFLAIPYGWCFLATIPYIRDYVPVFEGMNPYSPVMMVGVYIVARLLKRMNIDSLEFNRWILVGLSFISILLMAAGFRSYVSPFCTLLAAVTFYWAMKSQSMWKIGRFLSFMVPSLFTVYLLHSRSAFGLPFISRVEASLINMGLPMLIVYLLAAAFAFTTGLILDTPRRILVLLYSRVKFGLKAQRVMPTRPQRSII